MSVRQGHEWYTGEPGSWKDEHLQKLSGKWLACPGCTIDAFTEGNCHTKGIIDAFKKAYPVLDPPKFVSLCTKVVEGNGGLRDVLVTKDAIFAGCKPPRGAPTSKELGVSLPASIFGNPDVMARIREGIEKGKETRELKKREAKYGQRGGESTMKRDLPVRSVVEAEAERVACFEKAWAKKRAREERENKAQGKKQA